MTTHASQSAFDALLQCVNDPIFIVDYTTRNIARINKAAETLFGYEEDEVVGHSTRILHANDEYYEDFGRRAYEVIDQGEVFETTFVAKKRDGTLFSSHHTVSPPVSVDGSSFVVSVVRHISDSHFATETLDLLDALQAAMSGQRTIQDALHAAIKTMCEHFDWPYSDAWLLDEDRQELTWAAGWTSDSERFGTFLEMGKDLLFKKGEGLPGRAWKLHEPLWIQQPDAGDLKDRRGEEALKAGIHGGLFIPVIDNDQDRLIAVLVIVCTRASAENEIKRQLLLRASDKIADVVQLKANELKVKEKVLYFRSLIENNRDLIAVTDSQGFVRYISPSVKTVLGYEPEERIGRSIFENVDGTRDKGKARRIFRQVLAHPGAERELILWIRHKDESLCCLQITAKNMLDHPVVRGMVLNAHNITSRLDLEKQLVQTQKLEVLGGLTAGITHDFNNLLAVTLGYSQQLLEESEDSDSVREYATYIKEVSRSGARLIDQLLTITGSQIFEPERVAVFPLIRHMALLIDKTVGDDIEVSCTVDEDVPDIMVDPAQLQNALLNLAVNARDAMPRGGALEIIGEPVTLSENTARPLELTSGTYARIAASDTGEGIPEAILDKIFDPFFTTKKTHKGTGLGLSTIKKFAEQLGGAVTIDSTVGTGTTISIYIPAIDSEDPAQEVGAPFLTERTPHGRGERVLVVEDNETVRRFLCFQVKWLGYEVVEAENGPEALQIMEAEERLDVVLTDLIMPGGMTGLDLADRLRQQYPSLPVIYTTAHGRHDVLDNHSWQNEFLLKKPFLPSELARLLEEALSCAPIRRGIGEP